MKNQIIILLLALAYTSLSYSMEKSYKNMQAATQQKEECCICLDELHGGSIITFSCSSLHRFHAICIQNYATNKQPIPDTIPCPMCRTKVSFVLIKQKFPELFAMCDEQDIVIPASVEYIKPEIEIFEYMITTLRCDISRTIFIDDSATNVAAAEKYGIKSIVHQTYARRSIDKKQS